MKNTKPKTKPTATKGKDKPKASKAKAKKGY
jgi:hypothetical protein